MNENPLFIVDIYKQDNIQTIWESINDTKINICRDKPKLFSELLLLHEDNRLRFENAYRIITIDRYQPSISEAIKKIKINDVENLLLEYLVDIYILLTNAIPFEQYLTDLLSVYSYKETVFCENFFPDSEHVKNLLACDIAKLEILEDYNILPYSMSCYICNAIRFMYFDFYKLKYIPCYI